MKYVAIVSLIALVLLFAASGCVQPPAPAKAGEAHAQEQAGAASGEDSVEWCKAGEQWSFSQGEQKIELTISGKVLYMEKEFCSASAASAYGISYEYYFSENIEEIWAVIKGPGGSVISEVQIK